MVILLGSSSNLLKVKDLMASVFIGHMSQGREPSENIPDGQYSHFPKTMHLKNLKTKKLVSPSDEDNNYKPVPPD